jgi:G3E family GTPase
MNELGDVGIDQRLLPKLKDGVVQLTKGCICCAARNATEASLKEVARVSQDGTDPISRLVIETTGAASPASILQMLRKDRDLLLAYEPDAVVCAVDAVNYAVTFLESLESREQVALADVVILSKSEIAGSEKTAQAQDLIYGLNPQVKILQAQQGNVPIEFLVGQKSFADAKLPDAEHHSHSHDTEIGAVSLETAQKVSREALELWLHEEVLPLGASLLRCKGIIDPGEGRRFIVQGVRLSMEIIERAEYPEEPAGSAVVVIGLSLDVERLRKSFAQICGR